MLETIGSVVGVVLAVVVIGVLVLFVQWFKSHGLFWQAIVFSGFLFVVFNVFTDEQLHWFFGGPLRNGILIGGGFIAIIIATKTMMRFLTFGWMR